MLMHSRTGMMIKMPSHLSGRLCMRPHPAFYVKAACACLVIFIYFHETNRLRNALLSGGLLAFAIEGAARLP